MRDSERSDDRDQRAEAPERDNEAEEEQQVVDPIENMEDPLPPEPPYRLMPTRIEPHEPGIAMKLEGTDAAARWKEPKDGDDLQSEPREGRVDREVGLIRLNRI